MPIELPVRKASKPDSRAQRILDLWATTLAGLCFTIALAELVSLTPKTYRAGLSAAFYEAMLQSP